ncbi:MAG: lactate dehydrogenase, partial [Planctomycetota bacterium]
TSFEDHFTEVSAGDIEDAAGAEIVIVTSSAPMAADMNDRHALAVPNYRLFAGLMPQIAAACPDATVVVITNPVDVMTWHALELTGLPPERVLGLGTIVDTARLRSLLSAEFAIHADDLRVYVIGEHGRNQVPAFGMAAAGAEPIEDRPRIRELARRTASAGFEVFRDRGYTNYAIANACARLVETIAFDLNRVIPVSLRIEDYEGVGGCCLSLPAVVGRHGVTRVLRPELTEEEAEKVRLGAARVRRSIDASREAATAPRMTPNGTDR